MPAIPQETLKELVYLRERVADLEAELAEARGLDKEAEVRVREALGVTMRVTKTIMALARGGILSREQLMHYCGNPEGDLRLVDSMVKRARQQVPWIKIKSHYGYGYELEPESVLRVRAAMRGEKMQ